MLTVWTFIWPKSSTNTTNNSIDHEQTNNLNETDLPTDSFYQEDTELNEHETQNDAISVSQTKQQGWLTNDNLNDQTVENNSDIYVL